MDRSPVFSCLAHLAGLSAGAAWPDCRRFNAWLGEGVRAVSGRPIRFMPQDHTLPFPELYYEERIYRTGIVSTRQGNWHDFFNALAWALCPTLKAAINAVHVKELGLKDGPQRSRTRDALTLLDESGVLVASSEPALLDAITTHRWEHLFVDERHLWGTAIHALPFGHALMEKAMAPYPAMTARALLFHVPASYFRLHPADRFTLLDRHGAECISAGAALACPAQLPPLPVMGVPGWHPANDSPAFYRDRAVFRPLRRTPDHAPRICRIPQSAVAALNSA